MTTIESLMNDFLAFLDGTVVSVIFALAFIVFLRFVFQYFIIGGADEEKRAKGRQFVLWAMVGFFVMFSVWGLVNLLLNTVQLENSAPCKPTFSNNCASSGSTLDEEPGIEI